MLKCRVWDKINKKWVDTTEIALIVKEGILKPVLMGRDFANNGVIDLTEKNLNSENYVLKLCSPLKDTLCNYIYEGDLIEINSDNTEIHGSWSLYEVIYRNGTFVTSYLNSEKGKIFPRGYTGGELIDYYEYSHKNLIFQDKLIYYDKGVRKIGNIHDNEDIITHLEGRKIDG